MRAVSGSAVLVDVSIETMSALRSASSRRASASSLVIVWYSALSAAASGVVSAVCFAGPAAATSPRPNSGSQLLNSKRS